MTTGKKDIERLRKGYREELALLEAQCKSGGALKKDFKQLTKLRAKMK